MGAHIKLFAVENRCFLTFLIFWIIIFSGLRTAQHFSFGTNACDLSLFDYGIHSTLKGKLMSDPFHQFGVGKWIRDGEELKFQPVKSRRWESHFTVHFTPIIFLLVPFYLFTDGPLFLLYLQVLIVGLSALPLYLIAKDTFRNISIPFLIIIVYLTFRQLLIGLMHDIHMEMYFPLFFFSCYYFIAVKKRATLYLLFLTLALLIKEDIAILMFFFGLFLLFRLKERKYGAITAIYSLVYFIISMGIIIPYFRQLEGLKGSYVYDHYGESLFQIAWNILSHPELFFQNVNFELFMAKLSNIISPLLLLPFFSLYIVLALPPLFMAILSKIPQMYTFGIHYSATFLPFIFISLVFGLNNVRSFFNRKRQPKVRKLFLVIFALFVLINLTNSNFWRLISPSNYRSIKDYKVVSEIIEKIPKDASVAALSAIIPHIPKRRDIFMLPETGDAEYILIHSGINLWPYSKKEFINLLKRLESGEEYSSIYQIGDAQLFQKK